MKTGKLYVGIASATAFVSALVSPAPLAAEAPDAKSKVEMPTPGDPFPGTIGVTYSDSKPAFQKPVRAPVGAPNILLVLTDDVGFAAASTFGGAIPTLTLDKLAGSGLRFNRFHTTAMCSPTRASLLTGRNHHAVASGVISEIATGYPGYWASIPSSAATVAEVLRLNGYNTAFFGKHHNVPSGSEDPTAGPFELWPSGLGFEYFYGFIGGNTKQWKPVLYRGTNRADTPHGTGETLDHFLAHDLVHWIHGQRAAAPEKPFFAYFAPGSAHAPHQVPAEWVARFKGQFDQGWDRLRQESLIRQKQAGIVPPDTDLTPRPEEIPAWDSLSNDQRRVYARMMEVFAGMLAYQDFQIGQVLDELDRMGERENTLVIFVEGDNGASPEGGLDGSTNELGHLANVMKEGTGWLLAEMDKMGGPDTYGVYPVGWAWATNSPFKWTKQVASHLGGTRNGMVVSWPARIKDQGGLRDQFTHVNDIMPTILEAVGLPIPDVVDGVAQQPVDGTSFMYTFDDAKAPERHVRQYFEMLGNRAIYDHGWMASTTPGRVPWTPGSKISPIDYKWELYDLQRDFSQAHDLVSIRPDKLAELQSVWMEEARANKVLPLDDRLGVNRGPMPSAAVVPERKNFIYWGGDLSIAQSRAPTLNLHSFTIDADIVVPEGGAEGVLIASGSHFGGWSFHFEKGRPVVTIAASQKPEDKFQISATRRISGGEHVLTFEYVLAGYPGNGGSMTIKVDGRSVGRGTIGHTGFIAAGLGETFDIGRDTGAPVISASGDNTSYNGKISRIEINLH